MAAARALREALGLPEQSAAGATPAKAAIAPADVKKASEQKKTPASAVATSSPKKARASTAPSKPVAPTAAPRSEDDVPPVPDVDPKTGKPLPAWKKKILEQERQQQLARLAEERKKREKIKEIEMKAAAKTNK